MIFWRKRFGEKWMKLFLRIKKRVSAIKRLGGRRRRSDGLWFCNLRNCTLVLGIAFSTSPFAVSSIGIKYLPLMSPVKLEVDDILEVDLKSIHAIRLEFVFGNESFWRKDGKLKSEFDGYKQRAVTDQSKTVIIEHYEGSWQNFA